MSISAAAAMARSVATEAAYHDIDDVVAYVREHHLLTYEDLLASVCGDADGSVGWNGPYRSAFSAKVYRYIDFWVPFFASRSFDVDAVLDLIGEHKLSSYGDLVDYVHCFRDTVSETVRVSVLCHTDFWVAYFGAQIPAPQVQVNLAGGGKGGSGPTRARTAEQKPLPARRASGAAHMSNDDDFGFGDDEENVSFDDGERPPVNESPVVEPDIDEGDLFDD
jgi:hypothetical protein